MRMISYKTCVSRSTDKYRMKHFRIFWYASYSLTQWNTQNSLFLFRSLSLSLTHFYRVCVCVFALITILITTTTTCLRMCGYISLIFGYFESKLLNYHYFFFDIISFSNVVEKKLAASIWDGIEIFLVVA